MKILPLLVCVVTTLASEGDLEEFTKANNKFTGTVYKEIAKSEKKNFLVSPFSAETVLALTQSGSRGQTATELRNALHLPDDTTKIEQEIKTLLPKLRENNGYTLHTVNKVYVKENFVVKDEFKNVATDVYGAESENINFVKKQEAAGVINNWVEKQTKNKIQNLISPDLLNNLTRVVLVNALYFKANWTRKFYLIYTKNITFHKSSSETVDVEALRNQYGQTFLYAECHHLNAKFLELPLQGEEASVTFILPNDKEGLANLENNIDRALLRHNVTRERVEVAIPKFRIKSKIDLKKILQNLGVKAIFKDFEADLSGIAGNQGDLVVNEVIQKTFIDVNEEGIEAAAATFSIIGVPVSAFPGKPLEFKADHPFLFYIRVRGVIIFVGRVADPSQQ